MKRLLFTVYFLLSAAVYFQAAALSKYDIVISVKDKTTLDPLAGVVVGIADCGIWSESAADGSAVLRAVPEGRWKLHAALLGMVDYDTDLIVAKGSVSKLEIKMVQESFHIEEVTVTAKSGAVGASTASSISRAAIDHLQATSLGDVMQLLPGSIASNPSLNSATKASLRSVGADASIGTAVVVNGSPVSNNANLQVGNTAQDGTLTTGFSSTAGSGIDLRQISVDNVESVEVIRGIPSVEYGDLTSGVIIVNPKAGAYPFQVRAKVNPTLAQASISKGFALGKNGGALSADVDYASSLADERRPYQQYRRISSSILYSKTFSETVRTTFGAGFNTDLDAQKLDLSDARYQRERSSKNTGFKLNGNLNWQHDGQVFKSLKASASVNYAIQEGYTQEIKGNFGYMVTSAMRDGTVAANVSTPVFDVDGNEITNTSKPGYQAATNILPYEFLTKMSVYGKPLNVFAKISAGLFADAWGVANRIVVGADWKTDVNFGQGRVFDPLMPPAEGLRMRPYTDIPALNQLGLYAEDNITKNLWSRDLKIQLGLRCDLIQPGRTDFRYAFSPRINASFELVPRMLTLRGGWGITAKAPPLVYLYPDKAYYDYVNYSNIGQSGTTEANRLSVITTKVYDTTNSDLRIAKNMKSEMGLDFQYKGMNFSVTGFYEKLKDGYNFGVDRECFHLFELQKYEGVDRKGTYPLLKPSDATTVVLSYKRPLNNTVNLSRGVEFDFDFGKIKQINTSFILSGAFIATDSYSSGETYYQKSPDPEKGYKDIGVYAPGDGSRYMRLTTTLRAVHTIPKIGFVVTVAFQGIWLDTQEYLNTDNIYPIGYIRASDLAYVPLAPGAAIPSDIQKQIMENRTIKESRAPLTLFNLRLTKEVGKYMGFTFFLNNVFRQNPLEESKRNPGSYLSDRNPSQFLGLEAWFKF